MKKRIEEADDRRKSAGSQLRRVEIQASRASLRFRQYQNVVKNAKAQVNKLKKRHWGLLSQYEMKSQKEE